jgi:hypothetical protein
MQIINVDALPRRQKKFPYFNLLTFIKLTVPYMQGKKSLGPKSIMALTAEKNLTTW